MTELLVFVTNAYCFFMVLWGLKLKLDNWIRRYE